VWQDTRTADLVSELAARPDAGLVAERCGMAIAGYFSGPRLRWILDHVPRARERAECGELLFGTMETWLIWNLTGGPDGGVHVTDVTNASRTLLMDVRTCQWDP
jgi:glycerol kinase